VRPIARGGALGSLVVFLTLSGACGDGRYTAPPDGGRSEADASTVDAEVVPTTPDAGPGPDVAPRTSRLRFRPLLGQQQVDNRFFDPTLDPTLYHWLVLGPDPALETSRRAVHEAQPDAPSDSPVLRVRGDPRLEAAVVGDALGSGGPLAARVWVGRRLDTGGRPAQVSLSGVDARGADVAVSLVPRARATVARTSGLEWTLYEGRWDDAPLGEVRMSVVQGEPELDLYVTGPQLVPLAPCARLDHGRDSCATGAIPRAPRRDFGRAEATGREAFDRIRRHSPPPVDRPSVVRPR
jgi:hypothetical protein